MKFYRSFINFYSLTNQFRNLLNLRGVKKIIELGHEILEMYNFGLLFQLVKVNF